jgi:hypothetical protein
MSLRISPMDRFNPPPDLSDDEVAFAARNLSDDAAKATGSGALDVALQVFDHVLESVVPRGSRDLRLRARAISDARSTVRDAVRRWRPRRGWIQRMRCWYQP